MQFVVLSRLHEEQLLEKERRRLQDLEIEQQAAKQAEVERALRRTERILQVRGIVQVREDNIVKGLRTGERGQYS